MVGIYKTSFIGVKKNLYRKKSCLTVYIEDHSRAGAIWETESVWNKI